ncbi:MAG: hypothetical protein AAF846_29745 [Chloroflexota bacterium]
MKRLLITILLCFCLGISQAQESETILFMRDYDGTYVTLHQLDLNTMETSLTLPENFNGRVLARQISTSLDSPVIAFLALSDGDDGNHDLWTLDISTGDLTLHKTCLCESVSLNHDATWLAFEETIDPEQTRPQIAVLNTATGEEIIVEESGDAPLRTPWGGTASIQWIPNDTRLIFDTEEARDEDTYTVIKTYDIETETVTILAECKNRICPLIPAPNGEIAYTFDAQLEDVTLIDLETVTIESPIFDSRLERHEGYDLRGQGFIDWHPNSEQFLMIETWALPDEFQQSVTDVTLYDVDGNADVIINYDITVSLTEMQLNSDGSLLLYRLENREEFDITLLVLNIETGEQTILPIDDYLPQWLGR